MVVNAVAGAVFAYYFGIAGLGMGLALATSVQAYLLMRWMLPQRELGTSCPQQGGGEVFLRGAHNGRPGGLWRLMVPLSKKQFRSGRFVGGYCRAWWVYLPVLGDHVWSR